MLLRVLLFAATTFCLRRVTIQAARIQLVADGTTARRGTEKCGYGEGDILDRDKLLPMSYKDPRASIKNLGYKRGLAAKMLQLGRVLIESRVMALELPGKDARDLVAAMYGIVSAHVPSTCFCRLRGLLDNDRRTMVEIKKRRAELREVLQHELRSECLGPDMPTTVLGNASARQLLVLYWGHWSLYEPLTVAGDSVISARYLDERRTLQGNRSLRQIWHFAKTHILQYTELAVRREILQKQLPASELKRLRKQLMVISRLEGMLNVRLEFVEIDGYRNCVPAQPDDPTSVLKAASPKRFRVTLMFRERHWQGLAKGLMNFFRHPLFWIRKQTTRVRDEWGRGTNGHRVAMILKPILKLAAVAGSVLGVVTSGQTTFATLIADELVGQGLAAFFASSTMIEFLLGKVLHSVATDALTPEIIATFDGRIEVQRLYAKFDAMDTVTDVRLNLRREVQKTLTGDEVAAQLTMLSDDSSDIDPVDIEGEVRRYVEGVIHNGFIDELVPKVLEALQRREMENDKNFGWLPWSHWSRFRKGNDATTLPSLYIFYQGPVKQPWSGVAKVTRARMKLFRLGDRTIFIKTADQGDMKVVLSDKLKAGLWVHDKTAYRKSKAGFLLWHDWCEYRRSNSADILKNKFVYIDPTNSNGACRSLTGSCVKAITQTTSPTNMGFAVAQTTWKVFGLGNRHVMVLGTGIKSCETSGFELTGAVKACLRVKDWNAYNKWRDDTPRREQDQRWKVSWSSVPQIQQEVVKEMCRAGGSGICSTAKAGNTVLEKRLRQSSVDLEIDRLFCKDLEQNGNEELRKVQLNLQDEFLNSAVSCKSMGDTATRTSVPVLDPPSMNPTTILTATGTNLSDSAAFCSSGGSSALVPSAAVVFLTAVILCASVNGTSPAKLTNLGHTSAAVKYNAIAQHSNSKPMQFNKKQHHWM